MESYVILIIVLINESLVSVKIIVFFANKNSLVPMAFVFKLIDQNLYKIIVNKKEKINILDFSPLFNDYHSIESMDTNVL